MAHPKRKHSHSRGSKRRTNQKIPAPNLVKCPHCQQLKPAYRVCPFCGFYRGKKVLEIKVKAAKRESR